VRSTLTLWGADYLAHEGRCFPVSELSVAPPALRNRVGVDWDSLLRDPCWEGFERAAGRTADPSTTLRSGRDDKGREVTQVVVVSGIGRTADPSTTLRSGRDDKGRGVTQVVVVSGIGRTADPSITLRSGRDDKGREMNQVGVVSGKGRNSRSLHYGRDDNSVAEVGHCSVASIPATTELSSRT
jgi:hypothetical protein